VVPEIYGKPNHRMRLDRAGFIKQETTAAGYTGSRGQEGRYQQEDPSPLLKCSILMSRKSYYIYSG
jgi:hypothetical protein